MNANGRPVASVIFPEQYAEAASALGRAFINDPAFKVVLPEPAEPSARARQLTMLFGGMLAMERKRGEPVLGVVLEGRVVGAAVTEGVGRVSTAQMLIGGLAQVPALVSAIGWGGLGRGIKLLDELGRNHPAEPHLYLNILGVDPDHQRHHCGVALLEHLRELAALRPSLCGVYLETALEANVAYYQSRGYEVLGEMHPLGVRMWRMLQRRR